MDYRVLGPLEAVSDGGEAIPLGGIKQRAVLACLLMRHNEVVSTDRLIEATWGDESPSSPKSALQTYVSRLRRLLGDEAIIARAPGYIMRLGPDDLDAAVFERLVGDGRRAMELGNPAQALERFDAALELWNGDAYADFVYAEFARGETERLEELKRSVIEDRLEALLELGRHRETIPELERALEEHPLRERLWGLSMIALYRDGRQAEALRAYGRAADILAEELGVEPGPELRAIEQKVLLQDIELATPARHSEAGLPQGEVTFVAGSRRGSDDDRQPWDRFDAHVHANGGVIVPSVSNLRLAVFRHTPTAIETAIAIARMDETGGIGLSVHVTEAFVRKGEYVGNGISRTTRVATAAQPRQILLTAAAARSAAPLDSPTSLDSLPDLELPGMSMAEPVYAIRHPDLERATSAPTAPIPTNLPAGGLTSFIGRMAEIQEIRALAGSHRLVTLTGPGGVGKTRLAHQVAADLVGNYPGGVWLIELAPLEPGLVLPTIMKTIGVESFPGESAIDALGRHAAHTPFFLVLDNCEHVIDAVADTVAGILRGATGVGILATSRERLGLPGEQIFQVSGLATPSAEEVIDLAALAETEAVALFVERAQRVRTGFALDPAAAPAVATVCRRLDGIPLALELAASRLDVLNPREIAARLDDRFRLLVTRSRGVPARQQTLEAVVDWSFDLLSEREQVLLRRLAVFRGPFDLEAAEEVCTGDDLPQGDVLDTLGGLVAKSLVTARIEDDATSYALLETINAYARRLLVASDDADDLPARHADHYRRLARSWSENEPPVVNPWWRRLIAQVDNVRAALEWTASHQPVADMLSLVADLQWFWVFRSMTTEGLAWTQRALETASPSDELRMRLLRAAGPLAAEERRYADAERWTRESLDHWRAAGRPLEAASDLNNLAVMARMQGRLEEALRLVSESIADIDTSGDTSYGTLHKLAGSHCSEGEILCELGRLEAAETAARRAHDIEVTIETDTYLQHNAMTIVGRIALADGRIEEASSWYQRAEAVGNDLSAEFVAQAKNGRAAVALARGDIADAVALARQAIELLAQTSIHRLESLRLLALALLESGEPKEAQKAALDMVTKSAGGGGERWLAEALEVAGLSAAACGDVGTASALLRSAGASQSTAGIVEPRWHRTLVGNIGARYGFDITQLVAEAIEQPVLSTSDAGRLALGVV